MSSSRTEDLARIAEWVSPTPDEFRAEIAPRALPMVLRNVAEDWPLVIAAREDERKAMSVLEDAANGNPAEVLRADAATEGRFHYAKDGLSFNFVRGRGSVAAILSALRDQQNRLQPFSIAAQGLLAEQYVPGFARAHPMPFVPPSAEPRLWIGNAAKVATHNDPTDNVAVVAVGRRRFTLFPPDAEDELYMGPAHPTPAGARVSMVHVTAPDLDRFPRYAAALENAQESELSPGDAIFIPRDWFHHVEALESFNVLVNYWWNSNEDETHAQDQGDVS